MLRKKALSTFTLILCALGWGWLLLQYWSDRNAQHLRLPGCLFRELTGVPCPSCGTTRASLMMLTGNWLDAIRMNPLVIPVLLALFALPVWIVTDWFLHQKTFPKAFHRFENMLKKKKVYLPLLLIILAIWIHNLFIRC